MSRATTLYILIVTSILFLVSCSPTQQPTGSIPNMANPASVYCEEQGGRLEIRQDEAGGELGICLFPDGSECDEWAFFRGECAPAGSVPTEVPASTSTALSSPVVDPALYQGWFTYTHSDPAFSILLPDDWMVNEPTTNSPLDGHILIIEPKDEVLTQNIRLTFRRAGEDVILWPMGEGEGEFVDQGTLQINGESLKRVTLVCPNGQIDSIRYKGSHDGNILRDDVEFAFLFSAGDIHCPDGVTLDGKSQQTGEMIIASLTMP